MLKIDNSSEINSHINEDGSFVMELGFKVSQMCFIAHSIVNFNAIFSFCHLVKSKQEAPWLKLVLCR
jgi:hypothetical protein